MERRVEADGWLVKAALAGGLPRIKAMRMDRVLVEIALIVVCIVAVGNA